GCSAYRQSGTAEIDRRGPKMRPRTAAVRPAHGAARRGRIPLGRPKGPRVVNRLGRAPSEAGGVAFGCAGAFPYRPTIGGACGMYRPPIGPVSAIERAIVCMRMLGLADLRQPISRGFFAHSYKRWRPRLFLRALRKEPSPVCATSSTN